MSENPLEPREQTLSAVFSVCRSFCQLTAGINEQADTPTRHSTAL